MGDGERSQSNVLVTDDEGLSRPMRGRVEIVNELLATLDQIDEEAAAGPPENVDNLAQMAEIAALSAVIDALQQLRLRRGDLRHSIALQGLYDRLYDQRAHARDQRARGNTKGASPLRSYDRRVRLIALGCVDCLSGLPGWTKMRARRLVAGAARDAGIRRFGRGLVTDDALKREWGERWYKEETERVDSSANPLRSDLTEARLFGSQELRRRINQGEDPRSAVAAMLHHIPRANFK